MPPTNRRTYNQREIEEIINRKAQEHGVDPALVRSIAKNESSFNPRATSRDKQGRPIAYGVMQFLPSTGKKYGLNTEDDLYDAEKSIDAGTRHLKDLSKRYSGNTRYIAGAYHAGAGAVDPVYGPIKSKGYGKKTAGYTDKIQKDYDLYKGVTGGNAASSFKQPSSTPDISIDEIKKLLDAPDDTEPSNTATPSFSQNQVNQATSNTGKQPDMSIEQIKRMDSLRKTNFFYR